VVRLCFLLLAASLLLPGIARAQQQRSAAERMVLVPLYPGGPRNAMPHFEPGEISEMRFGVFLDPELRGQDFDEYLRERAALARASYELLVFAPAVGENGAVELGLPVSIVPAIDSDTFGIDQDLFSAPGLYAWAVRATFAQGDGHTIAVQSSPLLLEVGASDNRLGGLTGSASRSASALLSRLEIDQRRGGSAISCTLRGLKLYGTYPSSSSSFVSVPVLPDAGSPWPEQPAGGALPLPELRRLGELESRVLTLRDRLEHSGVSRDELAELVTAIRELGSAPVLQSRAKLQTTLASLCTRFTEAGNSSTDELLAIAGELLIALDGALGYGTVDLQLDYQQAFMAYAERSDARLQRLDALVKGSEGLLGVDGVAELATIIEEQRGKLLLLREEVERGRLARGQLGARMEDNLAEFRNSVLPKYKMVEGATCLPNPDRTRRLTAADAPQIRVYETELLQCEALRLLSRVWDIR
jgi:hypothetical protein